MRLRQAHALLEAATALEQAGLGIHLFPHDHDRPGNLPQYGDDHLTGSAEFTDRADGRGARVYNIDLIPGPGPHRITARVEVGHGRPGTGHYPLDETFTVPNPGDLDTDAHEFAPGVGAHVAARVAATIREYEATIEATFRDITRNLNT